MQLRPDLTLLPAYLNRQNLPPGRPRLVLQRVPDLNKVSGFVLYYSAIPAAGHETFVLICLEWFDYEDPEFGQPAS